MVRAHYYEHQMSGVIKLPLTGNRNTAFKFKQQITPAGFDLLNSLKLHFKQLDLLKSSNINNDIRDTK